MAVKSLLVSDSASINWHAMRRDTNVAISLFILFHQNLLFKLWYIFVLPRCMEYFVLWASAVISFLKSSILGTHSLLQKYNTPSTILISGRSEMCSTIFAKFESYNWVSLILWMKVGSDIDMFASKTPCLNDWKSTPKSSNCWSIRLFLASWPCSQTSCSMHLLPHLPFPNGIWLENHSP